MADRTNPPEAGGATVLAAAAQASVPGAEAVDDADSADGEQASVPAVAEETEGNGESEPAEEVQSDPEPLVANAMPLPEENSEILDVADRLCGELQWCIANILAPKDPSIVQALINRYHELRGA